MSFNLTVVPMSVTIFDFERRFDHVFYHAWLADHWTCVFYIAAGYLVACFAMREVMSRKTAFDLRWPLFVWSTVLALFSITGSTRMVAELVDILRRPDGGWIKSICNPSFYTETPTAFWAAAFSWSKVIELGDTAFIILRRRPLIVLHWYHHTTVLIFVWYSFAELAAPGRWSTTINLVVHSLMYTHYALRAALFRLPRSASMFVTAVQIAQMAIGLIVTWSSHRVRTSGGKCQQSYGNMASGVVIYLSYLALFVHFYYVTYLTTRRPASRAPALKPKYTSTVNKDE